ncbi:alpha/beta hydrolase [Polaribacter dokdonensis]|uniref:Alpha-glucosidase n=1 Tax=Polaribacter dokdonensis DSW-5 TaxID=1300348 RepID=A0A0N0UNJ7_9FLAO|nr:alpha/beta hydrolase-fold protein [Polaribacter dokdonensis]KOY51644.1 putative alpha-dextrin endo-1, 6-alpha-glucosidase [Polaribacter dokdonensis DSW-5]SEE06464.1 alpha-glucosidase [Polaribacter dokdonensis DSW-5]
MNKYFLLILSLLFIAISCKSIEVKQTVKTDILEQKSSRSKNVEILKKEFIIKDLNTVSHKVWVYLPPNYATPTKRFPVIYMHDAQNLFDAETSYAGEWSVDETLNNYYKTSKNGFIVVGVENGGEKRIEEYTPWPNKKYGGGKGAIYIDFLVNELKPYIDENYRTKTKAKHTAIIGSSLGGLISFYGGLKYPDVFGKIGALSPSFWFSNNSFAFASRNSNTKNTKLYLLIGDKEGGSMVSDTEKMEQLLLEKGFPKENLKTKIVADGKHTESFWRDEFLETILFLYD